ncbi:F-box only protein 41 [Liparis tanakae]|uniref:F-box only protein 41 n=1 Tax=Liparis tanakae TaxID=230148 RepID=A0A4Z2H8Q8_9TELE|nr:F-box only protein 41 [Liparis tanakae]
MHPMEDCPEAQCYHMQCQLGEGSYERSPGCGGGGSRNWGLRKQAIQNWQRRPYRNSTEGEEGDVSDAGSRTTESEVEMWEQERRDVAEVQQSAPPYAHHGRTGYRQNTGRSDGVYKPCRHEKSPSSRSNEVISPEILKMRAALFCIFTYLDTKTLLRAAEVCRDWKFVARHPAVWTRVLLENARISSKFLSTMSQWCTQTHSLILQNLKPRQRGKKETKDEYGKSTRGGLEEGLEALLKATGSNLLILKISHCPNLLTDRSLWLASCYCRALQAVTYRSATDPVGQEVIWALGAVNSLLVSVTDACRRLEDAGHTSVLLVWAGLDVAFRGWPHSFNKKYDLQKRV